VYRSGLAALDRYAQSSRGKTFKELSPTDQDSVLIDVETGAATGFTGQLRRLLRDGLEPHTSGNVRRSVLRREQRFRRLGFDRLSRGANDGESARSKDARSASYENESQIGVRIQTREAVLGTTLRQRRPRRAG